MVKEGQHKFVIWYCFIPSIAFTIYGKLKKKTLTKKKDVTNLQT